MWAKHQSQTVYRANMSKNIKNATASHQRTTGHVMAWDFPENIASKLWKSQHGTHKSLLLKLTKDLIGILGHRSHQHQGFKFMPT